MFSHQGILARFRSPFLVTTACAAGLLLVAAPLARPQDLGPTVSSSHPLETIVVTASRRQQLLARAPAAVSVISKDQIDRLPWDDYGDLLRNLPGLNVAQTGVRDINITARGATSAVATSQLLLLDGRSLYLDFFGLVMWDLLPVQASEIERIEVVRGPGSAVWGANAMTGVVNVITKRPKDMPGTTVVAGTSYANVVHAAATGKLSYRLSAGYFQQHPYARPVGVISGSEPPQTYPSFRNAGTHQSRADFRVDWETATHGAISMAGGYAGTNGILHSGIGPFRIARGSELSYVEADWSDGAAHVRFFGNFLNGKARNLLTLGSDALPLAFRFVTHTYDLDLTDAAALGQRNTLTYGADYRSSAFRLGIAPAGRKRTAWGGYVQDDIVLGDHLSWQVGARYDRVDPLEHAVLTPRTTLLFLLAPRRTLRLSYGEAFRTPSVVDAYLDTTILEQLDPFLVPAAAVGNPMLMQEHMKAYELGYVATLDSGAIFTISVYRNLTEHSIDFFVKDTYRPGNLPPPGPNLPSAVLPCFDFVPGAGPADCPLSGLARVLPSDYSYRNLGRIVNRGVELSLRRSRARWNWFANLSWQHRPRAAGKGGIDVAGLNVPPKWRLNVGVGDDIGGRFWSATVNYQGKAYWADVLYARGSTAPFATLNGTLGWRFLKSRLVVKAIGQNLFDERVQQHIFGDILSQRVEVQLSYTF